MTTRSIVTSQPDVACDVCARRLLRGEQPDYFLVDGRRRIVCELCAPRATHEGWKRESEQPDLTLPPLRPRRGRGLLQRLMGRAAGEAPANGNGAAGHEPSASRRPAREASREVSHEASHEAPYDIFAEDAQPSLGSVEPMGAVEQPFAEHLQLAVEVFNAGEYPRRMAGVARSLGAPVVSVRQAEHVDSVVRLVFAWELCWYRYEVDLGEADLQARAGGQGTELEELDREEREGNALASESGAVSLAQ